MSDVHDDKHDEGFEDVEDMLRRNRPAPSAQRLDEIKQSVQRPRRGRNGGFRRSFATSALIGGLLFGGGGALVLAQTGGSDGSGTGSGKASTAQYGGRPCPKGQHPDRNGNCVPTGRPCPKGQHPDRNGNCVPTGSGGVKGEEESQQGRGGGNSGGRGHGGGGDENGGGGGNGSGAAFAPSTGFADLPTCG